MLGGSSIDLVLVKRIGPGNVSALFVVASHALKPKRTRSRIKAHNDIPMTFSRVSAFPSPNELEQYKVLIRHVHGEPVMLRRALRLAFRNLSPTESVLLRDWLQANYAI